MTETDQLPARTRNDATRTIEARYSRLECRPAERIVGFERSPPSTLALMELQRFIEAVMVWAKNSSISADTTKKPEGHVGEPQVSERCTCTGISHEQPSFPSLANTSDSYMKP